MPAEKHLSATSHRGQGSWASWSDKLHTVRCNLPQTGSWHRPGPAAQPARYLPEEWASAWAGSTPAPLTQPADPAPGHGTPHAPRGISLYLHSPEPSLKPWLAHSFLCLPLSRCGSPVVSLLKKKAATLGLPGCRFQDGALQVGFQVPEIQFWGQGTLSQRMRLSLLTLRGTFIKYHAIGGKKLDTMMCPVSLKAEASSLPIFL